MRALALSLLVAGCASSGSLWKPLPDDLRAMAPRYPDAPAVVLDRDVRFEMVIEPRQRIHYLVRRRERRLILNEGGFKHATVRVTVDSGTTEVVELRARSISPDGQVHELGAGAVLTDENRGGTKDKKARTGVKLFHFPNVQVGSVLDFYVVTDTDHYADWFTERIADTLPVARFHFEAVLSLSVRGSINAFHVDSKFEKEENTNDRRIWIDLKDIPARPEEAFTPPWQVSQPWVVFRTLGINWSGTVTNRLSDWSNALRQLAKLLYVAPLEKQARLDFVLPAGCDRPRCWAERAIELARERAPLSQFRAPDYPVRRLAEVLASGRATNVEKALLMEYALEHAGVVARLAGVSRSLRDQLDEQFALPSLLDHVILYLPAQTGLEQPIWIDPSCEWCAPGEIPPWIRHATAVIFERPDGDSPPRTQLQQITGSDAGPNSVRITHEATLGESGELNDSYTALQHGNHATDWLIETQDLLPKKWHALAEAVATNHAGAQLTGDEPGRCERKQGECRWSLRFRAPGLATSDGDRLLVPLSVLRSPWDGRFDVEKRTEDFTFGPADTHFEEVLRLTLPDGYVVDEAPAPASATGPAVDATLESSTSGDVVTVRRTLVARGGIFPRADYAETRRVLRAFADMRTRVLVLRKKRVTAR